MVIVIVVCLGVTCYEMVVRESRENSCRSAAKMLLTTIATMETMSEVKNRDALERCKGHLQNATKECLDPCLTLNAARNACRQAGIYIPAI